MGHGQELGIQEKSMSIHSNRRSTRTDARRLPMQDVGDPDQKIAADFAAVDLVQHFVPPSVVKIKGDVANAGPVMTLHQRTYSGQALADRVLASGKQIHRKIVADFREKGWVSELRRGCEKGRCGRGLYHGKAERIFHEGINDHRIAAEPVKWRAGRFEGGV